ncbi:putative reverse transcriptase domain-containing protein, partial [Tanacetum coccineum]
DYPDEPEDGKEDDNEDFEEDPSEEHELEDDVEDPEKDPNEVHEPEDGDTKEEESYEGFDEIEPLKEDETATLIDAFVAGSPPFPVPPTSPTYDQAPLGHTAAMIRMRDDIPEEDMPPHRRFVLTVPPPGCDVAESSAAAAVRPLRGQYDFVDIVKAGHGLIRSPGHDARTIARAADRAEDVGSPLRKSTCPKGEIKKLEIELWNLRVRGNDVAAYTLRFQELALMCTKFLADETEKVDKYISGLPDNIHGNVMSARPKTLNDAIEMANDLMDQKLRTYAERQIDNKRKADDSSRNNQQQQPHKKQNVARAYTVGPGEKKLEIYPCAPSATTTTLGNVHPSVETARGACYECGNTGHIKKNCPKLKNRRNGNGNGVAQGRAYALGGRDASPDSNVITGTFLLNNRYATILFDTGADRSFVSNTFNALINITPTTLENHYDIELADGKIIRVNTIIRGCTLNFMNHPFNIDLMPVPLGSFDIIIGMDWLTKYQDLSIYDKKIVTCRCRSERVGCDVFLAHITMKKAKAKSKGKRLEDVPFVKDFPEDFLGIPPARQVEFQIDLVPCVAPVPLAPYQLAPSIMKELAEQLQ